MLSQFGHTLTVSSHPVMSEKASLSKRMNSILCRSETYFDHGCRSSGICPCSFRSEAANESRDNRISMNIEPDSDLDFNPGAYIPDDVSTQRHIYSKRRKRRSEVMGAPPKRPLKRRSMKAWDLPVRQLLICETSFSRGPHKHPGSSKPAAEVLRYVSGIVSRIFVAELQDSKDSRRSQLKLGIRS